MAVRKFQISYLILSFCLAAWAQQSPQRRTELNLLGKVDTAAGESRRNENIPFNLVDNNALKELNVRLGTTATIVQEFRPERGYFGTEFGNAPSLVLHVPAVKSTGIHGSLYESHLNSVFSARSFFQVGDVQPARENNYGFTFGAPLWRGAFVALDAGQHKVRGSVNGNVLVPRPDERTPLATDPQVRAIVSRWLNAYPDTLPNRTDINERALNTNAPQRINHDNGAGRVDQRLGERDRLTLRYLYTAQRVLAFQLVAGQNPNTDMRSHTARITWNRTFSEETSADFSVGFDRIRSLLVPDNSAVGTTVAVSGLQSLGPDGSIPIDRAMNLLRYGAAVRRSHNGHTWTAGADLLRRQMNGVETDVQRGYFSFAADFGRDAITNLRLGLPNQYIVSLGDMHRGFRNWDMQYYAGDVWRLGSKLTVNFGLRFQPQLRPKEVNNLNTIAYDSDCNNLAPRFGLAYRLPGFWGVLRAAYGLDYGEIFPVTFQQVRFTPPGNYKIMIPVPNLMDPLSGITQVGGVAQARANLYLLSPELATPYAHQYNFNWEPLFSKNWRLQMGYVGSRSNKLLLMWYQNRAHVVPGIPQNTATLNARRPDPTHAEYREVINGSRGYYDAARVALVVPRWRGLSMDAAYWFSKAIDLGSAYTNTAYDQDSRISRSQSEFLRSQDMKGPSPFDQPHAFLWHANFDIPRVGKGQPARLFGGWTLSAITLLKTGTPFTVVTGSDAPGYGNVDGNGNDRPNLLDMSVLGRTAGNPDTSRAMLPRSAFGFMQPTDDRGNLGRNTFRKGGIRNVNAAVSRTFALNPGKRLIFRAESINLFNTPQFAEPGLELVSANFGQITNTLNDGRTFRFLLQFGF